MAYSAGVPGPMAYCAPLVESGVLNRLRRTRNWRILGLARAERLVAMEKEGVNSSTDLMAEVSLTGTARSMMP